MNLATCGTAWIVAGATSVVVPHTFGSVDYRWVITPTTNLGGRDWWASDKAADSFKINISSPDLVAHAFDWDLVPGLYGTATIPAGETSVTVPHSFGSADFRWAITPTTDLGGRNWWPSDKAADSFKINISGKDLVDHTFDWVLISGVPEEGEHYSTVADVKEVLETDEPTWDVEILSCIVAGDSLIDGLLNQHDLTVPASVPQNINSASRYFAAWLFRKRRDPTGAAAFKEEADGFLQAYIDDDEAEPAFKVVNA